MFVWTNRNVLEEPGAHDTGSLLGENTTLVFRRVIISTKETQVLIELKLELQEVEGDTDQWDRLWLCVNVFVCALQTCEFWMCIVPGEMACVTTCPCGVTTVTGWYTVLPAQKQSFQPNSLWCQQDWKVKT